MKIKMMHMMKWSSLTVFRDHQRIEAQETWRERKIKAEVMDDGVDGGSSGVKTPHSRKWNQFPPGFPEAVPHESSSSASTKQRTADLAKPVTFERESVREREREREYIETAKETSVHYIICTVQRTSRSQWGNKLGLHREAQGWLNVRKSVARGKKWEVEPA